MGQVLLGRPTVRFAPLPVQRGERTANWQFHGKRPIREVPYVPTPDVVVRTMLDVANVTEKDVVYDLGCGDGRIVIAAAEKRGARGVGVDIDPRRIQECKTNAIKARVPDRVRFLEQSLFSVDVGEASVVALYLLPWMNTQLRPKLLAELRPGSRIVAHQFAISDWPADRIVRLMELGRTVFCWIVPAKCNGRWQCSIRTGDGVLRRGTIELEQEFQTVVGLAKLSNREMPLENMSLSGDRLTFTLAGVTYYTRVCGDMIRGSGRCSSRRGELEVRARHL